MNNQCFHYWQGKGNTVTCLKCGKTLTPQEYAAWLDAQIKPAENKPSEKPAKKKSQSKKKQSQ